MMTTMAYRSGSSGLATQQQVVTMRFRVKVNASSKSEGVRLLEEGFYQIRTHAPAEGGKANRRVLELLARELGCSYDRLRIVAGSSSSLKQVEWV